MTDENKTPTDAFQSLLMDAANTAHQGLDATKASVTSALNFVQTQAPDVIHELIMWHLVCAIMWVIIGLFFVIPCVLTWKRSWKYTSDDTFPTIILNGGGSLIGGVAILVNAFIVAKILIAPKLWLLEYAISIIHSG